MDDPVPGAAPPRRTLRTALLAVAAVLGVALGTVVLLDPDDAESVSAGTGEEPAEGEARAASATSTTGRPVEPRIEELREAERSTTTLPPHQFPSTGPPAALNGGWRITTFDRGPGGPELIPWDPRDVVGITFRQSLAEGEPGAVSFMQGCGPIFLPVEFAGDVITADATGRSEIEPSSCPGGPAPDLPIEALFLGPPPQVRWSLSDGVLRIEHPSSGLALTAAREEALHEPLPEDLETPHALYGLWAFVTWTDEAGTHEVAPPEGVDVWVRFSESSLGPHLGYSDGDCNGSGIEVSYLGDRIVLEKRGPSTAIGCPDAWHLPEVNELFATPGQVTWRVDGDELTLVNDATEIEFRALRVSDR